MRRDLLHVGAANLKYEIREITTVAHELERLGVELTWENIGDPVQKGEIPPEWIRGPVRAVAGSRSSTRTRTAISLVTWTACSPRNAWRYPPRRSLKCRSPESWETHVIPSIWTRVPSSFPKGLTRRARSSSVAGTSSQTNLEAPFTTRSCSRTASSTTTNPFPSRIPRSEKPWSG